MSESIVAMVIAVTCIIVVVAVGFYVLFSVALGKIFRKAGESLWKGFVPYYNVYIQYKISWNVKWFWRLFLPITICSAIFQFVLNSELLSSFGVVNSIVAVINFIIGILIFVLTVGANIKLSWSMGHGIPYALGITFLPIIFIPILGFGKSEYIVADVEKYGHLGF